MCSVTESVTICILCFCVGVPVHVHVSAKLFRIMISVYPRKSFRHAGKRMMVNYFSCNTRFWVDKVQVKQAVFIAHK